VSGRTTLEEPRYDPFGRRVWVSNTTRCAPTSAIECLISGVRRIIWDGDRELAEIQAPRDTTNAALEELDSHFPVLPSVTLGAGQYGDPNTHFGRVVYSPGLAVDQPMSVTRYEYKDRPPSGSALSWPTTTLMVLWDYRGTPTFGLFTDGAWGKPYQLALGQQDCPIPGSTGPDRCFLHQWSVMQSAYDQARAGLPQLSWMGSVLRNKRDGTGLEYKRNRVYDPQTGRFTQEDPIGLAGGLNLYGYADGDPVNFSDPFGLCPFFLTGRPCSTGTAIGVGLVPIAGDAIDIVGALMGTDLLTGESITGAMVGVSIAGTIAGSGKLAREVAKPSIGAIKGALEEVHAAVGKLPKGSPGKFGSPQRGTSKVGYRLDPPHPKAKPGTPEVGWHINWWDYSEGKRGRGGRSDAVRIPQ
jgi:RHS repeat-associated protein